MASSKFFKPNPEQFPYIPYRINMKARWFLAGLSPYFEVCFVIIENTAKFSSLHGVINNKGWMVAQSVKYVPNNNMYTFL